MRPLCSTSLLVVLLMICVGCAKPDLDFVNIKIGMSKEQVIQNLGKPTRMSVIDKLEIFEYEAYDRVGALIINRRAQCVRFVEGKVESFGNKGDFDSTKTPTSKVVIDQKISTDIREENTDGIARASAPAPFDLRFELEKLDKMKKDGLINETEFKELRQRALDKAKAQ